MFEFQTVWGWQPALYLFLGGMGSGAFITATVLSFVDRQRHRSTIGLSMWAAAICLIVGLLLLLSELVFPLRGMAAWESFVNFSSWMTYGAWGVLVAVIVFILAAFCTSPSTARFLATIWKGFPAARDSVCTVLSVIGSLLGVFVAVYTGVLLMSAPGIPFWNTPLLPVLFTVSALDTGVALVEIIAIANRKRGRMTASAAQLLEKFVVVLVGIEVIVLSIFVFTSVSGGGSEVALAAAASANAWISGTLAPYFWCLVVLCGLLAPIVVAAMALKMHGKDTSILTLSGAVGALIGGCALRFIVLMAGTHADLIAQTVAIIAG